MLESLFGNPTVEKVLFYLRRFEQGYAREMSRDFGLPLSVIQQQLGRLERGGILVSRTAGRTRLYQLNPRYFFLRQLEPLIDKAFGSLASEEVEKYYVKRTRPRRAGKP